MCIRKVAQRTRQLLVAVYQRLSLLLRPLNESEADRQGRRRRRKQLSRQHNSHQSNSSRHHQQSDQQANQNVSRSELIQVHPIPLANLDSTGASDFSDEHDESRSGSLSDMPKRSRCRVGKRRRRKSGARRRKYTRRRSRHIELIDSLPTVRKTLTRRRGHRHLTPDAAVVI